MVDAVTYTVRTVTLLVTISEFKLNLNSLIINFLFNFVTNG